jgi:hypothetical protein
MNWKTVQLELASTEHHPHGSAARAFLLHVPIASDGWIDHAAIDRHPSRATVRRFWASEPDSFGFVEPLDGSWLLKCGKGTGEQSIFLLEPGPLKPGRQVKVRQPGGTELPFRIASVRSAGRPS